MDQMPPSVHLLSGLPPGIHAALSGMLPRPDPARIFDDLPPVPQMRARLKRDGLAEGKVVIGLFQRKSGIGRIYWQRRYAVERRSGAHTVEYIVYRLRRDRRVERLRTPYQPGSFPIENPSVSLFDDPGPASLPYTSPP
jgi:hypothetical protein